MMNDYFHRLSFILLLTCSAIGFTSCYRMPTDNDFSLVPTTNNPAVTCEKSQGLPGLKM